MAKRKRKTPSINGTSSADIAFMLLIFFLITTSMDTDQGLPRRLPPAISEDVDIDVKKRNTLAILVSSGDRVMCQGEEIDIKQLKEKVKEFIKNPNNDEHYPEKIEEDVPYFGKMMITKNHVISLNTDRETGYQIYISVQNELATAYAELRDEISKQKFGKLFMELDESRTKAVKTIYPQKISEAEPKNYGGKK